MLFFVMPPRRLNTLCATLLGLVLAGAGFLWIGAANPGASVLGVRISKPAPIEPAGYWLDGLKQAVADKGVSDWTIQPHGELGSTISPRQMYYRATINGVRDGEPVKAQVELVAVHGGEWRLSKWSEQ